MTISNQKKIYYKSFQIHSSLCVLTGYWDNEGYLLAVSTSPESSSEFGDYLAQHRHLRFLSVGGCYGVDFASVY